jgi:hypothetical protein
VGEGVGVGVGDGVGVGVGEGVGEGCGVAVRVGVGDGLREGLGEGEGEGEFEKEIDGTGIGLIFIIAWTFSLLTNQNPANVIPNEPTKTIINKSHLGNFRLARIGG